MNKGFRRDTPAMARAFHLLVVGLPLTLLAGCEADGLTARPVTQAPTTPTTPANNTAQQNFQAILQAAERGDAASQVRAADAYLIAALRGADTQKAASSGQALRWYRAAAAQNNARGQNGLGVLYNLGIGIPRNPTEAMRYFKLAADQGHADAQVNLGQIYVQGTGVSQDFAEAKRLFTLAAEQKNARAQNELAVMYDKGQGVPVDYTEAAKWVRLAADQGNATAQFNLARYYAAGTGLPQDNVLAYFWFNLSAPKLAGVQQTAAMAGRDASARKLSSAELTRAQGLAKDWKPGNVESVEASLQESLPAGAAGTATPAAASGQPAMAAATPNRRLMSSGTGFAVSKGGHVLTNAHVINDCGEVRARLPGNATSVAALVAKDVQNDLAVVKLDSPLTSAASFRGDPAIRQGDGVVVYGFPLGSTLAADGNLTTGNVSALSGLRNDSRLLQVTAPVQAGNSGGPLVDMSGNVVGVVVSKLDALSVTMATGDIPQNVNFALKASVARNFLDANGIAYETAAARPAMQAADVGERIKRVTLKIECWR